jgi:uncharacterized protein (TIGR02594 family)
MKTSKNTGLEWLDIAYSYLGLKEIPGKRHNKKIVEWWEAIKAPFRDDETPWCGAFVGGVLHEANFQTQPGGASARAWRKYGKELSKPAIGCVVVFWRGKPSGWSGHVGFVVGKDRHGNLMVLGGNQGNEVNIKPFSTNRVLAYRWPSIWPAQHRFDLPLIDSNGRVSTNEE